MYKTCLLSDGTKKTPRCKFLFHCSFRRVYNASSIQRYLIHISTENTIQSEIWEKMNERIFRGKKFYLNHLLRGKKKSLFLHNHQVNVPNLFIYFGDGAV